MRLTMGLVMIAMGWLTYNYGVAVGYVETLRSELEARPIRVERVAVCEVDIPRIYDVGALDAYCRYDWQHRDQEGWTTLGRGDS